MNINIDSAIFIGFLAVNLVIGLFYSRGIKNIKEYAIGDRNFSTATIAGTLVATWVSGSDFFTYLSEAYSNGLYFIWAATGDVLCLLLVGIFFAPRLGEFLGKISIAEAMGELYGKHVRMITAIAGCVGVGGIIAVQFKVAGMLFEYCFNVSGYYGIIIGGLIVAIYSSLGGIRSVTFTDIIQLFTFGTIIPTAAFFILQTANIEVLTTTLETNPLFDYKKVFDFTQPQSLSYLFLFFFIAVPGFNPAIFQRIAMSKDTIQIRRAFIIASFTCLFITFTMSWIGIMTLSIKPDIEPSEIVKHVLLNYSYVGLKGLTLAGIMAMVMSTADSYINSTSVLIVHDLWKPLGFKFLQNELTTSRLASFLIAIFALTLALTGESLMNLIILTNSFYLPIVTVPFIAATLGFRSTGKSVLIGMAAGLATIVACKVIFKIAVIDSVIPGMLANLIFLFSSHYLLKQTGGWVGIKDYSDLNRLRQQRKDKFYQLINSAKNFNLLTFFRQNSPRSEAMYAYLGIFCIISAFTSMHLMPEDIQLHYPKLINFIYPSVLFMATLLVSYPMWLVNWKSSSVISVFWNATIFYILVCVAFLQVIMSNFAHLQLMAFMVNLIIVAVLVRWQWALFMIIVGSLLTVKFFKFYAGVEYLQGNDSSIEFEVAYLVLLTSGILVAFLKPKQEYIEATEYKVEVLETNTAHLNYEVNDLFNKVSNLNEQVTHFSQRAADHEKEIERLGATAQKILNNVNHELRLPIGNVINFSEMLNETLGKSDNKLIKELSKEVYDNSNRVSTMILNMLDLATLDVKKIDLQKATINFSELVMDRVKSCRKIYLRDKKINFELTIEPEVMIVVDPNYVRQTVDNLVINAINFSESGLIKVSVSAQKKSVVFTITDQGKGIPAIELSDIFTPFKMGSNTESKAQGRGVGLALCKSAIEAHGGTITADSNGEIGATLSFLLPR